MGEEQEQQEEFYEIEDRIIDEDGICRCFYNTNERFSKEGYEQSKDKFRYLHYFCTGYVHYNRGRLRDAADDMPFPKWAINALFESFQRYNEESNTRPDPSLDRAFGVTPIDVAKRKRQMARWGKGYFFDILNAARMYCDLKITDAAHVAWKVLENVRKEQPWRYGNLRASQKSLLDNYYREFPQAVFIRWVADNAAEDSKSGPFEDHQKDFIDWIDTTLPDVGVFIKRKMRLKKS